MCLNSGYHKHSKTASFLVLLLEKIMVFDWFICRKVCGKKKGLIFSLPGTFYSIDVIPIVWNRMNIGKYLYQTTTYERRQIFCILYKS